MEKTNYKNKKRKSVAVVGKKRFVLSVLLVVSLGANAITVAKDYIANISNNIKYNQELKPYEQMVNESEYRTDDKENYFINYEQLAEKIFSTEITDKDDFYHHLIGVTTFISGNKDQNFQEFIKVLNLEELSKVNPNIPSEAELNNFLLNHGFINEDGTLSFDKWEDYDKEVFTLEQEIDELKGGK